MGRNHLVIKATRLAAIPPNRTLFYQLAVPAILLPLVSPRLGEAGFTALSPLVLGSLAFQIVVVAFASYLVWFWLVTRYPASRLSSFSFFTPLFGVVAGGVLLDERISPSLLAALGLVALGIYLVNRAPAVAGSGPAD